jgi:hypothetical protein
LLPQERHERTLVLASNRVDVSAAKALQLYGQCWGIETSLRDIKDYKFGS